MVTYSTIGRLYGVPIQVDFTYNNNDPYAFKIIFYVNKNDDSETVSWTGSVESLIESMKNGISGMGDLVFRVEYDVFCICLLSDGSDTEVKVNLDAIADFVESIEEEVTTSLKNFQVTDEAIQEWLGY